MFSRVLASSILCLCATAQSNDPDKIYKLGDPGITKLAVIYQREPDYTNGARKKKIQGIVGMDVIVGKDGKPADIKLVHLLDPGLDTNAVKAVQTWKFTPCQKDGQPVRCALYIEISYHLY